MSSYNSVVKIKYTDSLSDAVSLDEYIVFADERSEKKYIVFRFSNNVNQKLIGMKFEVSQYDMHDNLLEKSVVIYNNFQAKANATFVPKAKLGVQYACQRISVRLVQAAFDRVLWNEGEYVDNSYKFEHYARDEKYIEETQRPKVPVTNQRQVSAVEKEGRFSAKVITKKNIAKFPAVYYWLTCILLLLAIAAGVIFFPKMSKKFTIDGYDLQTVAGKEDEVWICGYEGDEENLTVPEHLGKYRVTQIGKGAFSRLRAVSITLPSSVTFIEAGAFKNMKSLRTVSCASENLSVASLAFDGVKSLMTFEMSGARLAKNSLYGCYYLNDVRFGSTAEMRFIDLVGEDEHVVLMQRCYCEYPDTAEDFFEGVKFADEAFPIRSE